MARQKVGLVKMNGTMPRVFIPGIVSDCPVPVYYPKE